MRSELPPIENPAQYRNIPYRARSGKSIVKEPDHIECTRSIYRLDYRPAMPASTNNEQSRLQCDTPSRRKTFTKVSQRI